MDNGNSHEAIGELVELWRAKLQGARERYLRAIPELHRKLLESRGESGPDSDTLAGSRRAEAEAFAQYCRVLATFTELATNGKLPGPDASEAEFPTR